MDLREPQSTLKAVDQKLESEPLEIREYLGISGLGDPCTRKTWLSFRWASPKFETARVRRLLDRGKREESYVVKLLRSVGVEVTNTGTDQVEVTLGPWVKGHIDGLIQGGLKESNQKHILEIKTANQKSFKDMQEKGLKMSKPIYYAQVQCYMLETGIDRAFFWMVSKDDDSVYTERVHLDREFAERLAALGNDLASSDQMPQANGSAVFGACKYCEHYPICFMHKTPLENCRTCKFGRFCSDGVFRCNDKKKTKAQQLKGCSNYQMMDAFRGNPWERP